MNQDKSEIGTLFRELDKQERTSRRKTMYFFVFLIVFGSTWIIISAVLVSKNLSEYRKLEYKTEELIRINDSLKTALKEAGNILEYKTYLFSEFSKDLYYNLDASIRTVLKEVHSYQLENLTEPNEESFDRVYTYNSPQFISYVLKEAGILDKICGSADQLISVLPPAIGDLKNGDIIVYESGYSMLYFQGSGKRPSFSYVIGMTPYGVIELSPYFAKKIAALRPEY